MYTYNIFYIYTIYQQYNVNPSLVVPIPGWMEDLFPKRRHSDNLAQRASIEQQNRSGVYPLEMDDLGIDTTLGTSKWKNLGALKDF